MEKRELVRRAFDHAPVPHVPWHFSFTVEARDALVAHFGTDDLDGVLGNHFLELGSAIGFFDELGNDRFRDVFGVVWDRTLDQDIGNVEGCVLPEPTLAGFEFPDPRDPRFFADLPEKMERAPDRFRVFYLGFSLFERAWTLRGMENLMMDFLDRPDFVRDLLDAIADHDIAMVRAALEHDVDAVCFGDDWGQQRGLLMGHAHWTTFLRPPLARMCDVVRDAGKRVMIHSCGDVDELFDDLVDLGVSCFNPFQPEVMDVEALLPRYRGRLAFHGGLSTQRTLPFGTVDDVRAECRRLLRMGAGSGYVFAPAHAVEGDVPLENMLAMIEEAQGQPT